LLQHLTYQVKEDYSWEKMLLHTGAQSPVKDIEGNLYWALDVYVRIYDCDYEKLSGLFLCFTKNSKG